MDDISRLLLILTHVLETKFPKIYKRIRGKTGSRNDTFCRSATTHEGLFRMIFQPLCQFFTLRNSYDYMVEFTWKITYLCCLDQKVFEEICILCLIWIKPSNEERGYFPSALLSQQFRTLPGKSYVEYVSNLCGKYNLVLVEYSPTPSHSKEINDDT